MASIIISLTKEDLGNLLLGGQINIMPSIQKLDNLSEISVKMSECGCTESEVQGDGIS